VSMLYSFNRFLTRACWPPDHFLIPMRRITSAIVKLIRAAVANSSRVYFLTVEYCIRIQPGAAAITPPEHIHFGSMKIILSLPAITAVLGVIVYVAFNGKPSELGRVAFAVGLLAVLLALK